MELPLAALERILKKAGGKRISTDATKEYARMIEEHISGIAKGAALLAEHNKRNTVLEKDIILAKKRNKGGNQASHG
jgi:histone H3/H4